MTWRGYEGLPIKSRIVSVPGGWRLTYVNPMGTAWVSLHTSWGDALKWFQSMSTPWKHYKKPR